MFTSSQTRMAYTARGIACAAVAISAGIPAPASTPGNHEWDQTEEARDARMAWWREARFGMFIHWGLYAIPAGEWRGKQIAGIGEWIMNRGNIPLAEYEPLASEFNPTCFDPDEWASIAADAGMKYLVITSKHHDGFCLFDTAETDWDVVDRTPYARDLLTPLAEACRKSGIRFCTYYSILDWSHPSQRIDPEDEHNTLIDPAMKPAYVASMKKQLKELLDSCDPDVLWFDGEWVDWWTEEDGVDLYRYLRGLKPELIINNRVGKGRKGMDGFNRDDREYVGDFGTPEQQVPDTGVPGVDWESCLTMNDTWGFKRNDHNWKSREELIQTLVDTASKGGNLLLNVGPTACGEIPQPSVERLAAMGEWLRANSRSIYGTSASPAPQPAWGRCTRVPSEGGDTLFLHVFDWPPSGRIEFGPIDAPPRSARMLATGEPVECERVGEMLVIESRSAPAPAPAIVIEVELAPSDATVP